jgi:SAM-dependent methyltransferase
VATHRARRFAGIASIVDVGCGIGGDLIPLARTARAVGIDLDAARLLLACHNLRVHGLSGRVDLVCADARTWIPGAEALFFDPSRRTGDRKGILSVEGMSPPLAVIRRAAERCPDLCVKMSPLLRRGSVEDLDPEIEHVSLEGECREAVVWCGRFRTASARATVLPSGESIEGDPRRRAPVAPAGSHLHDPDPALVASRLLGDFAERFGLALLDPRIAYLTGDRPVPSAMARSFRILERFPFQLKRLRRRIAAHGAGRIEIRKRGFPISPEELRAKLRPRGPGELTVVLARVGEGHDVFLAERDPGPAAP